MKKKTFVLDTNVLLHDPNAFYHEHFIEHNIVLPLIILEELDKFQRFNDQLGKNARSIIRQLQEMDHLFTTGHVLRNGTHVSIAYFEEDDIDHQFPWSIKGKRNQILFAAYQIKKKNKDVVIMLTKDFILCLKCGILGIEAKNYISMHHGYDALYPGFQVTHLQQKQFYHLLTKQQITVDSAAVAANEYCKFIGAEGSSILARWYESEAIWKKISYQYEEVWGIRPKNDEQICAMDLLLDDQVQLVTLLGQAGTGKTLVALTCGLAKVFDENIYNKILISRPIMPLGKDIGYLPGTKEEKMLHWMRPIYDNLEYICGLTKGNAGGMQKWILESEKIEMEAVTFLRGRSLANAYIIIDEAQNLTPHEIKTIISRAGQGTKVILTGDPTQIDNPYLDQNSNGLTYVIHQFKNQGIHGHITLAKTERSELAGIAATVL